MLKHGTIKFLTLGYEDFSYYLDYDYKSRWLWYPDYYNEFELFDFDKERGFKTPEACEKYMIKMIKKKCKSLLQIIEGI